ncbi:MAG TPA: choice-of-anchor D domain-containing protein [Candidatus Sulfotelmatobacter sp.]|nr:choice-of-anchor D domain-containing protein [Candidatus Sulfotelmatobacter sp.]
MKSRAETKHDVSPPLRDLRALTPSKQLQWFDPDIQERRHSAGSPYRTQTVSPQGVTPRAAANAQLAPTAGISFDGITSGSGWAVPDTNGAAGATQFVEWVNTQFAVYSKASGALIYGPAAGNTLWTGFGGSCEADNNGDVLAQYDKQAGRWLMMQHAILVEPYQMCIAVSTTSDATGSYYRYAFPLSTFFSDYPKLGVWPDAYYVTSNLEDNTTFASVGAQVCALDRTAMLAGTAATSVCFQLAASVMSLLPSDWDGSIVPPAGSPNHLLNLGANSLNLWQFHADFQTPANSFLNGPINIPVPAFARACGGGVCVPQPTTTQTLDSLGDRLMYRLAYRHFADGHEALVATHSVGTPAGIRWYEIRNPGGTPVVFQQGTYRPDSNYRWMGSIAMDQVGDIAVGYSESSTTLNPSIYYAGRVPSDTLGTLEPEVKIITGGGVQSGNSRWGDYSSLSIDPVDDCTFWYANEYYKTTGFQSWTTRIASFKFSNCGGQVVSLSPSGLSFPNQNVGTTSASQPVTLTNNQSVALNITNVAATGDFAESDNCVSSSPIAPNGTCIMHVTFTPTAAGTRTGSLNITDDAGNQSAPLSGTGLAPVVTLSASSLTFAKTALGRTSATKTVTVTNSGTASLVISSIVPSGNFNQTNTCAGALAPAGKCSITVSFTASATGTVPGVITINDNAFPSLQLINLSGLGAIQLSMVPLNLAFGSVNVGTTSAAKPVTLTNNLATTLSLAYAPSGDYAITSNSCGSSLGPSASCVLSIVFNPSVNGTVKGAVTITSSGLAGPQEIGMGGTGVNGTAGPLTFSAGTINFPNVVVGTTTALRTIVVTNSGSAAVHFSSIALSGNYNFVTGTGPCGTSLAAGAKCNLRVTFSPAVTGATYGSVTITDDAAVSPQIVNLVGTAIMPVTLAPAAGLAFGTQTVGTSSAPLAMTISNNQTATALTLKSIAASGNFAITTAATNPCGSTVPALGSCNIGVVFSASSASAISGTVTVNHNALFSPQELALTGTGQ